MGCRFCENNRTNPECGRKIDEYDRSRFDG